jgi:hypothetical protein
VLEPDEGKLSSPVLRGLGASNGARPLGRMLGSVRYIQTPLAVQKSGSGTSPVISSNAVLDSFRIAHPEKAERNTSSQPLR